MFTLFLMIFASLTSPAVMSNMPESNRASYVECAKCVASSLSGYSVSGCGK